MKLDKMKHNKKRQAKKKARFSKTLFRGIFFWSWLFATVSSGALLMKCAVIDRIHSGSALEARKNKNRKKAIRGDIYTKLRVICEHLGTYYGPDSDKLGEHELDRHVFKDPKFYITKSTYPWGKGWCNDIRAEYEELFFFQGRANKLYPGGEYSPYTKAGFTYAGYKKLQQRSLLDKIKDYCSDRESNDLSFDRISIASYVPDVGQKDDLNDLYKKALVKKKEADEKMKREAGNGFKEKQ